MTANGMVRDRRRFLAGSLGALLLPATRSALAQSGSLAKIIFPFAAGGGGDALCRILAQELATSLDRTVIVENRTGGDGLIGIRAVKNGAPDGSMILVTTGPTMYLLPMVETEPSFDAANDFVPVSLLARFEFAIVADPSLGIDTFKDFIGWLKANPDKATYGVPSNGTIPHFAGFKLEQVLGIKMTRVPYRGTAPVMTDVAGGHLPFGIVTVADAIGQYRGGGVKLLAVSSADRSPFVPEVPTLRESGIDLVADSWYGMWLRGGSAPDVATQLGNAVATALARPELQKHLLSIGLIPVGTDAQGLAKELAADIAFWQPIVKATGYKISN